MLPFLRAVKSDGLHADLGNTFPGVDVAEGGPSGVTCNTCKAHEGVLDIGAGEVIGDDQGGYLGGAVAVDSGGFRDLIGDNDGLLVPGFRAVVVSNSVIGLELAVLAELGDSHRSHCFQPLR